ncbi:N-acetyltransferase [Amycolatopsis antarctica]|uniref:N-acetyltransferase n=1 Tax=Amycolatopsis antarctica TaxID=1854586 RepID=A0A263CZ81_9PSEU|nr:GNAT family N-acetyltransferase [Amycolatopsis antarctica]OZM71472.1 N-acetyltransferase [Amycolatopsis antarctica]
MGDKGFRIRTTTAEDAGFLREMLLAAATWRPGEEATGTDVLADPAVAHYVDGWPRTGDRGVVAVAGEPVGAAWLRYLPADDPGYGFVAADVPELSMGVTAAWRGRGVGRALLRALLEDAHAAGVATVSLSVERDNHAVHLYRGEGFTVVAKEPGAYTMIRTLTG